MHKRIEKHRPTRPCDGIDCYNNGLAALRCGTLPARAMHQCPEKLGGQTINGDGFELKFSQ